MIIIVIMLILALFMHFNRLIRFCLIIHVRLRLWAMGDCLGLSLCLNLCLWLLVLVIYEIIGYLFKCYDVIGLFRLLVR
jgi:hypothetical protein